MPQVVSERARPVDAPPPAVARRPERAHPSGGHEEAALVAAVRRFEQRIGIYRPGRSPWVWVLGPGLNFAGTVAVTVWVGLIGGLGWAITLPLAIFCGVAMGIMAWAFIGNTWEQEEEERLAAEASVSEHPGGHDRPG